MDRTLYHSTIKIVLDMLDATNTDGLTEIVLHHPTHNIKLMKRVVVDQKGKNINVLDMILEDDPNVMLVIDEETRTTAIQDFIKTNF